MRIRSIKPEFFKHDDLGSLSAYARLLFIGLWCMADCAGRLEDRPKRIKAEVLPYDDIDVEKLLVELVSIKVIVRYEVESQWFIEVTNFSRHQRITGKEAEGESRFPAVPCAKVKKHRGSNGETSGKQPESLEGKGDGREGKGDAFVIFWNAYPKKKSKDGAMKAFAKADVPLAVMLQALEAAKASEDWHKENGKWIPYPATWLNGKRWEDEAQIDLLPAVPQESSIIYTEDAFKTPRELLAETKAREDAEYDAARAKGA